MWLRLDSLLCCSPELWTPLIAASSPWKPQDTPNLFSTQWCGGPTARRVLLFDCCAECIWQEAMLTLNSRQVRWAPAMDASRILRPYYCCSVLLRFGNLQKLAFCSIRFSIDSWRPSNPLNIPLLAAAIAEVLLLLVSTGAELSSISSALSHVRVKATSDRPFAHEDGGGSCSKCLFFTCRARHYSRDGRCLLKHIGNLPVAELRNPTSHRRVPDLETNKRGIGNKKIQNTNQKTQNTNKKDPQPNTKHGTLRSRAFYQNGEVVAKVKR